MLAVENIDLSYGASRALRDVSMIAEPGKVTYGSWGVGSPGHKDCGRGNVSPQEGQCFPQRFA